MKIIYVVISYIQELKKLLKIKAIKVSLGTLRLKVKANFKQNHILNSQLE